MGVSTHGIALKTIWGKISGLRHREAVYRPRFNAVQVFGPATPSTSSLREDW